MVDVAFAISLEGTGTDASLHASTFCPLPSYRAPRRSRFFLSPVEEVRVAQRPTPALHREIVTHS